MGASTTATVAAHSFLTTHNLTLHPTQTLTLESNISSISLSISNLLSLITSNHVVVVLICGGGGSVVLSCGGGGGVEFLADWNLSNTKIDFTSGFNRILHEIRRMDKFFQPYDKECMKMALLKHEETFKEQVYELHRLYQVQKMLMKNLQVSKHNHQENICFNNYPQKNKIDLEQPATTKDQYDHVTKTSNNDQETEEDECEIELTLAPTSFNRKRRMTNKPGSLDSVPSFSSSSTGSSFLSSNRRNSSSSDISLKQSPWMYQVLSLNMST
ncbi:hypothetical protein QVD17_10040 [Tagetes erecta]|uniref:Uncharacterized protein n=1 Tax=Tagetes erecta TaxID=13708 RepID=A0AAD8L2J8_TARER|nr:hypothetical protein QVD17_10040 [Tagetes erecta]